MLKNNDIHIEDTQGYATIIFEHYAKKPKSVGLIMIFSNYWSSYILVYSTFNILFGMT